VTDQCLGKVQILTSDTLNNKLVKGRLAEASHRSFPTTAHQQQKKETLYFYFILMVYLIIMVAVQIVLAPY
jgi:hypothetical protein